MRRPTDNDSVEVHNVWNGLSSLFSAISLCAKMVVFGTIALLALISTASADDSTNPVVFRSHTFVRTKGNPNSYTSTFKMRAWVAAPFTMHVVNGDPDGRERVSSAEVLLNGTQVLGASDLNPNVASLDRPVSPIVGSNTLQVTLDGKPGSEITITISGTNADQVPPQVTIVSPSNGSYINTSTPRIDITYSKAAGFDDERHSECDETTLKITLDGVDRTKLFTIRKGDATATIPASLALAPGLHTLVATLYNEARNQGSATSQFTVVLNAPTIQIVQPALGAYLNSTTPAIALQYSANGGINLSSLKVLVNGADLSSLFTKTNTNATATLPPANALPQGANQIVATIQDLAGNQASASTSFNIDTTPPTISFSHPASNSYFGSSTVAVAVQYADDQAIDPTQLKVTVDGIALSMTALPASATCTASGLANSAHLLVATIRDLAGNAASAQITFYVDTTIPTIHISQPAANALLNTRTPQVLIDYTDVGGVDLTTLKVLVNGANASSLFTATSTSASAQLTSAFALPDGQNTITAQIANLAGGVGTATSTFLVDTTPPTIAIQAPPARTNSNAPTVTITYSDATSGVDPYSLVVTVDGVDISALVAPGASSATGVLQLNPPLVDGTHVLTAKVKDRAGNQSAPASLSFVVDTTPPVVSFASPADNSFINNPTPTIALQYADGTGTGVDTASIKILLQQGTNPATDITTYFQIGPQKATGAIPNTASLSDGTYVLTSVANDLVGNSGNARATFVVDTVPPTGTVQVPAANAIPNTASVAVALLYQDDRSGVDTSKLVLTVDGVNQTSVLTLGPTQATGTLPPLPDGVHTIQLTVFDRSGNSSGVISQTFTTDTTPPTIIISVLPPPNAAGWNNTNVTLTSICSDATSGIANCPAPVSVTTEGVNQVFSLTATDNAGNSATAIMTINLDKTPPIITATVSPTPNASGINTTNVTVTFACSDALSGIASCPAPLTATTEGANQVISGTATDNAGNTATASVTLTIIKNPPALSIVKTHAGSFTPGQTSATYTITVSDAAGAGPTSGTVTVTDTVPTGLMLVSLAGTGWSCAANTCSRSDVLNGGTSYPPITATVNVATNATSPVVNVGNVSGGGSASATASDTTLITALAAKLAFATPPAGGTAGTPLLNVVVQEQDALGNLVPTSNAAVTIASTPPGVTGTITVNAVNGLATFSNLVLNTAGTYTLTASSTGLTGTTSNPFTITAGAAALLVFTTQPAPSVQTLQAIATQVTVEDNFGDIVTSYNGPVTLSLASNPGGAVLAGNTTQNAVNGVASFANLSVNTVGTGYTLVASAGNLTGTSNAFKVTGSPQLASCVATGSHSVLAQGSNVTAYVPNGVWLSGNKNVEVLPIEGTGKPATIATPNVVNSCASNWLTGQTVCTANGTDVYLITGSTLTNTLTSGSNGSANASAGTCQNCGVAINPVTNQAVISMGLRISGSNATEGIQVLDLNTNALAAPIGGHDSWVSEGIVVDPTRNFVLAPNQSFDYELFDLNPNGKVYTWNTQPLAVQGTEEPDSAAEDCSTGIALASEELSNTIFVADLTQTTLNAAATPSSTWSAPAQVQAFPEFSTPPTQLFAGTTGIAVASGSHLGIVTGENGGSAIGVFQLPATSGSGTPTIIDYVAAAMPLDTSGNAWQSGSDPHPTTAYVSPTTSKAYGVLSENLSYTQRYLAVVDLQAMLTAPRSGPHTVDPAIDLVGSGVVRYIPIGFNPPAQLVFSMQPAGAVAGQSFPVQVAVEDALGNAIVNGQSYSITLTLSGAAASLIPKQIVGTVKGVASFSVAVPQAGTYTLTAISTSLPRLPAAKSNAFTVTPSTATYLSFLAQPTNTVVGQGLPTIQVAWLDQFGNPTPSNLPITLALSANGVGATLVGNTTVVPVNGVASFTGLTVDRVGNFTMAASAGGLQVTSGVFQVTGSTAAQLAFVNQPSAGPAGLGMNIVVVVEDVFGNIVTTGNYPLTITLGANPTGAVLSSVYGTSATSGGGYAFFYSLTINYAGLGYTMVASSPGLKSATSRPFNMTGAGPPATLTPSSMREGTSVSVTITAQNANFQQGVTTASFGPGLMVGNGLMGGFGPVTVTSPTTAVAQVSAAANASPGLRTVLLQSGATQLPFFDAFTVMGSPVLDSISPASGQTGQTLSVTINAMFTNFVQGTTQANFGPGISVGGGAQGAFGPVTVNGLGTAVAQITIASGASIGLRPITVQTGTEVATSLNGGFLVLGPVTGPAPIVTITSPIEGSEVTTLTNVTGTVSSPNLATWTLDYAPVGSNSFTTFTAGTTPTVSGTLDPTLLLNGMITVRLTAVDQSGQTTNTTVDVLVTRKLKVGNFTLSFLDLSIPVAGIPIQIVRTYDSRDKTVGDFGVGWSLSVKSVRMDTNGILGKNWIGTTTGGLLPTYCVQPGQNYVVSARMQDGTVYQFVPTPTPATQCALALPPQFVDLTFVPTGSTPPSAQLSQANASGLMVVGGFPGPLVLADPFTFQAYGLSGDTDQWILTLPNGQKIQVSVSFGVQAITDTNGNTLSIGPNGITSSHGPAVTFSRDALNRITGIRDPNLNLLQYAYDGNGDLASFTDQNNNTSKFTYDSAHDLLSFNDPTGAQPIRNVYDDSGRLIQQVDAFGHVQDFTHNMAANTETFTDFLGNTTAYVYDGHGNIIQETDALGNVTSNTFDANDNVTSTKNSLGQVTSYTYDANNNRTSTTDPLGHVTTITYNSLNKILTVTDPSGHVVTSTYDSSGNMLSTTNANGNTSSNIYDVSGNPITSTDPLGHVSRFAYDSSGNLTSGIDAAGVATAFTYDANGNQLSRVVARATPSGSQTLTTQYQYDAHNNLVSTILPDGSTTQTTYNSIGKKSATTDELGRQTAYQYDASGRLIQVNNPDGSVETTSYDAVGRRTQFTDRSGVTTSYAFDALGRLTATTNNGTGAVTQTTYDAAGRMASIIDPRGNVTQYAYDAASRRTQMTDALRNVTSYVYDAAGNEVSITDANGHATTYLYDANKQRTRVTFPDGTFSTTTFNAAGLATARTDPAGKTTTYSFDALGRLITVTDALGQSTKYAYDEVGNRVSQTDANNHTTTFAYDQRRRRTSRTLPQGQSESFTYDAGGKVISHSDFNGKATVYAYDAANRLLSKTPDPSFHAPTVAFTYNASGKRATMTDACGTSTYQYDSAARLISISKPNGTLSYSYDSNSNLISLNGGAAVSYTYDALNRLASVSEPNTGTSTYSFDAVGNLASVTYPNGVAQAYSYDTKNQLTNLAVNKGASPVASYAYTLDPAGHRLSVSELNGRMVNYTDDNVYRLTSETVTGATVGPNGAVTYTYDSAGNRTQATSTLAGIGSGSSTYDADDRPSTDTYDANGNTTASNGNTNVYDFENHLVQHGGVTIVYDGDGNRVSKTAGGVTTKYLVDSLNPTGFAQVLQETVSDGSSRTLVYGLDRISQRQFVSRTSTTLTSFYVHDGHASLRALTDATGAITDTYDYDAFGNLIHSTGSTPNEFLFAGEQFDSDLGFYYNRARYLNTATGRFLTVDPFAGDLESPLSLHRYLYAGDDPANLTDPSGKQFDLVSASLTSDIAQDLAEDMPSIMREATGASNGADFAGKMAQPRALQFALSALGAIPNKSLVQEFFGKHTGAVTQQFLTDQFASIFATLFSNIDYHYGQVAGCVVPIAAIAFSLTEKHVGGSHDIWLCPRFFKETLDGRAHTVFHEATHIAIGAIDFEYGLDELKKLADDDSPNTVWNTNSYTYFAEYAATGHAIGPQFQIEVEATDFNVGPPTP